MKGKMNSSEALFGFAGWLTSREEQIKLSRYDEARGIADLVGEFIKTNKLPEVRDEWTDYLTMPKKD